MVEDATLVRLSKYLPPEGSTFDGRVELPAPPEGYLEGDLAGSYVVAHLVDHSIAEGWLSRVDQVGVTLLARDGERVSVAMERLMYLLFVKPIRRQDKALEPECRSFDLRFDDGSHLTGCAVAQVEDALGVHLFRCFQNSVRRVFVPRGRFQVVGACEDPDSRVDAHDPCARRHPPTIADNGALIAWLKRPPGRAELATGMVPIVDLAEIVVDDKAVELVPSEVARRYGLVPLAITDSAIAVAMANPENLEAIRLLGFISGRRVECLQASLNAIHDVIFECYDAVEGAQLLKALNLSRRTHLGDQNAERIEQLARERPVVRFVNMLITEAVHRRASDIHIRPGEEHFRILYRIDGTLVPVRRLDSALLPPIVSRIKIVGDMDITERRRPQDGRAVFSEHDLVVDMRISVIPTVAGESVVIRLLNAREGVRSLSQLGLAEHDERRLREALSKSFGMVLVTGPTGSGKSTTLYAALLELRKRNVNIITVEDPVEYFIDDIEQIQVNASIGFTFARALRNILRHDPDVVMVGEIRDHETAEIAVESALTGHLILSTLHTNDAATAITRLLDLGVQPFLLKSTILAVLAQRLVKRNCPHCLVEEPVDAETRRLVGATAEEKFYRGAGCDACDGLGHHGRTAVYELLMVTPGMRDLVNDQADAERIRAQGLTEGMTPLTQNALEAARQKITSLSEVFRVRLD